MKEVYMNEVLTEQEREDLRAMMQQAINEGMIGPAGIVRALAIDTLRLLSQANALIAQSTSMQAEMKAHKAFHDIAVEERNRARSTARELHTEMNQADVTIQNLHVTIKELQAEVKHWEQIANAAQQWSAVDRDAALARVKELEQEAEKLRDRIDRSDNLNRIIPRPDEAHDMKDNAARDLELVREELRRVYADFRATFERLAKTEAELDQLCLRAEKVEAENARLFLRQPRVVTEVKRETHLQTERDLEVAKALLREAQEVNLTMGISWINRVDALLGVGKENK